MSNIKKGLFWAAIILAVALIAKNTGMSRAAMFGIVMGLSGVAIGHIGQRGRRSGC